MKLITNSIQQGLSLAYISLVQHFSDLLTHPLYGNIESMDTQIHTIIDDMRTIFLSLGEVVGGDENIRNEYVSKLQTYGVALENRYQTLYGYRRELNHIAVLLEEKYQLQSTAIEDIQGIDYHLFIHECLDFIMSSKTDKEKQYKLSQILCYTPIRMTKDSFLQYIKRVLKKVNAGTTDEQHDHFLSIFKQLYDGRLTPGYNKYFCDLAMAIEDIRTISEGTLTPEEIVEYFEDIQLLNDTIDGLFDLIVPLHFIISEMSILFLLNDLSFSHLMNQHIAFYDLYYTIQSLLNGKNEDADAQIILETLPERIESIYSQINDNYSNITQQLYEETQKQNTNESNQVVEQFQTDSLIRSYLLINIHDLFSFDSIQQEQESLPESYVHTIDQFLQTQFEQMQPQERKLRMQYMMSILPLAMNDQYLAEYINRGIEGTSNEIKKAYVVSKIGNFMESCGYFNEPHEEHMHDTHHHDHTHCDCDHH